MSKLVEKKISFLRSKALAIAESGALSAEDALRSIEYHEKSFALLRQSSRRGPSFRFLDEELNMKLRMAFREKAKADVIRKKLEAEYGFSSLSASVDDLVAGILKRGRIGSNKEADQVREFLSEEGNSREVFEESDFIVLERYLVAWEKR